MRVGHRGRGGEEGVSERWAVGSAILLCFFSFDLGTSVILMSLSFLFLAI